MPAPGIDIAIGYGIHTRKDLVKITHNWGRVFVFWINPSGHVIDAGDAHTNIHGRRSKGMQAKGHIRGRVGEFLDGRRFVHLYLTRREIKEKRHVLEIALNWMRGHTRGDGRPIIDEETLLIPDHPDGAPVQTVEEHCGST